MYSIFSTSEIIIFHFSIICKTKHMRKIISKVYLSSLCIFSSYLVSKFVRLLSENIIILKISNITNNSTHWNKSFEILWSFFSFYFENVFSMKTQLALKKLISHSLKSVKKVWKTVSVFFIGYNKFKKHREALCLNETTFWIAFNFSAILKCHLY